jgi:lipopolysaccharide export LptBFGC system permease protein LptF
VVFTLIGVPFALRYSRGGVGIVIGASLVVFAVSYVGLIAGEGLAKAGRLSPVVAMWAANVILAVIGAALLFRMGKESITRGSTLAALIDDLRSRSWLRRTARRV